MNYLTLVSLKFLSCLRKKRRSFTFATAATGYCRRAESQ